MSEESIFVSYSSRDRDFAMRLTKELQNLGASIWIDQLGIGLGENWDNSIEDALEVSNTLLLLISKTSAASQNVQDEVSIAKGTDKKIVPILIEQCKLPMRWQRMQYADYIATPEKAIKNVLTVLNLEKEVADNLENLLKSLSLTKVDGTEQKGNNSSESNSELQNNNSENTEDLLVSEKEINRATIMHQRAIKKNWQLIGFVGLSSIAILIVLFVFFGDTQIWYLTVIGCLLLNLLAIKPYGSISRRSRTIELMELLKIKRDRLTRVINKLTDKQIENFNTEFKSYITIQKSII